MARLKEVEKVLKSAMKSDNPKLAIAYYKLLSFFEFLDYEGKTNHREIINKLYSPVSKKYTLYGIAQLMHISEKTLRRYRTRYVDCFNYYLTLEYATANVADEVAFTEYEENAPTKVKS